MKVTIEYRIYDTIEMDIPIENIYDPHYVEGIEAGEIWKLEGQIAEKLEGKLNGHEFDRVKIEAIYDDNECYYESF